MKQRRTKVVVIGSVLIAVAPKCPICFFAYFGVFGVATASTSAYYAWLAPLTAMWLALTVGVLALPSGGQRRYGPALLGLVAGIVVLSGKFYLDEQTLVYGGVVALLGAAVWRSWCRTRPSSGELCQPCELAGEQQLGTKKSMPAPNEIPTWGGN